MRASLAVIQLTVRGGAVGEFNADDVCGEPLLLEFHSGEFARRHGGTQ